MNLKILALALIVLFSCSVHADAQTSSKKSKKKSTTSKQLGMNDVMSQLVNGVKTSSFTDGQAGKDNIMGMLSGIGGSDFLKYGAVAGALAGALNADSFVPGWDGKKDGVLNKLSNAGSMGDVAEGVLGLLGGLDAGSLTSSLLKNKSTITTALGILSLLK